MCIGCECAPADYLLNQYKFNDHRFHWVTELACWCGFEQAISVPAFQYVYSEYVKKFINTLCNFHRGEAYEYLMYGRMVKDIHL